MKTLTLTSCGLAYAGIQTQFDEFAFVPFTGRDERVFRTPLDPALYQSLRVAHTTASADYNQLVAEFNTLATELNAEPLSEGNSYGNTVAHKFLFPLFSELAKLGRLKREYGDSWKSNPFNWEARPLTVFRADIGRTANGNAKLTLESDPNDARLLVRINVGPGVYKSTVRVNVPDKAKIIAFGENHGHKRTWDEKLVVIEPGDVVSVNLRGSTNSQTVGYTREYRWDGEKLVLEQTAQQGYGAGKSPYFSLDQVSIPAIQVVVDAEAEQERTIARLKELVSETDDRRIQTDTLLGKQDIFTAARARLTPRVEKLAAEVDAYNGHSYSITMEKEHISAAVLRSESEISGDHFSESRRYQWTDDDVARMEQDVIAYLNYCRTLDRNAIEAIASNFVIEIGTDHQFGDGYEVRIGDSKTVRFGSQQSFDNAKAELKIREIGNTKFRMEPFPVIDRLEVRYLFLNTADPKEKRAVGGSISGFHRSLPHAGEWNGYRLVDGGLKRAVELPDVVTAFIAVNDEIVWQGRPSQLADVSQAISKVWNTPYGQAVRATKRQDWILAAEAAESGNLDLPKPAPHVVRYKLRSIGTRLESDWLQERSNSKLVSLSEALEELLPEGVPQPILREVTTFERENLRDAGAVLIDFGGRIRESGYSANEAYYVVASDGSLREPDIRTEYEKVWKGVFPDELALRHAKSFQHAEHDFEVRYSPEGGLTEAQKATVDRLQEKIAEKWEGRITGGHNLSPSMGNGWGLTAPTYRRITKTGTAEPLSQVNSGPANLDDLAGKWGGRIRNS